LTGSGRGIRAGVRACWICYSSYRVDPTTTECVRVTKCSVVSREVLSFPCQSKPEHCEVVAVAAPQTAIGSEMTRCRDSLHKFENGFKVGRALHRTRSTNGKGSVYRGGPGKKVLRQRDMTVEFQASTWMVTRWAVNTVAHTGKRVGISTTTGMPMPMLPC
jgi:hypothetical protein